MIRAPSGMRSPASCDGTPVPSQRSWWCSTHDGTGSMSSGSSIPWPTDGWLSSTSFSRRVSGPGLRRISSGTASLPMSCSRPARRISSISSSGRLQTRSDPGGEIADPGRVTALERVACVDGARERRGGLEPRRPVRRPREPPQLRDRGHVRAVDADPVLALALRPVEGDVGDAHERVAVVRVVGVRRDPGGDAERPALLPLLLAEGADDALGRVGGRVGARAREDDGELVAAEPVGLCRSRAACSRRGRARGRRPDGRSGR